MVTYHIQVARLEDAADECQALAERLKPGEQCEVHITAEDGRTARIVVDAADAGTRPPTGSEAVEDE